MELIKRIISQYKKRAYADNKGWGLAGKALILRRSNPDKAAWATRNSNRIYRLIRGKNRAKILGA